MTNRDMNPVGVFLWEVVRELILRPLSWLYGATVWVRNRLYDDHALPSYRVNIPIICVGNIAVGGTGKTPMVEYLIRMLSPDYSLAVLSLGYGRKTRGFRLAGKDDNALTIGDEAMQVHRTFPNIPVAVCKDRVEGIRRLQTLYPHLQGVILDDGFQYRRLHCDFTILLTAADRLYTQDSYLPFGTLRDVRYRAHKAHVVVVTKCADRMQPIDYRVLMNELHVLPYQTLCFAKTRYEDIPIDATPLVVTAIAQPDYLLEHIRKSFPKAELLAFRDHHYFTPRDCERILTRAADYAVVVTTQKDMERLLLTDVPQRLGDKLKVVPVVHDLGDYAEPLERAVRLFIKEKTRKLNSAS